MSVITKANELLRRFPIIKKILKRAIQVFFYLISSKTKKQGRISLIAESDNDSFFGYYDKCPWDATQRYFIYVSAKNMHKYVCATEPSDIILLDLITGTKKVVATTNTCNTQQGCMLQWIGPDFDKEIIYNDFLDGEYKSVILNVFTLSKRIIDSPVYSASQDGKTAYSLDFARLHRLRPGYGYDRTEDATKHDKCPESPCLFKIDLVNNQSVPILTYTQLMEFENRPEMEDAEHKINHIMVNPIMSRIMFLHRWIKKGKRYSRLVTCDRQGEDLYNLLDDNMVSHCNWLDEKTIIAYAHKNGIGNGYYKLTDKTKQFQMFFGTLKQDGHPSLSPDNKHIITDTYPNKSRTQTIYLGNLESGDVSSVGRVFAPFRYDNDTRCDLHPRFNRDGSQVCFDAAFEGKRKIYLIDLDN